MSLVTLTLPAGRPAGFARSVLDATHAALVEAGVAVTDPEQTMIGFVETAWENWAFGGGRLPNA